jgi:hypothetical protein
MDDLKRIAVSEARNAVSFTGDDLPIAFDNDARGPNSQIFEQSGESKSVSDFSFLAINCQFHNNKKTASAAAELPGNTVSSFVPLWMMRDGDSHASLRRCDPDQVQRVTWLGQALSLPAADTPSIVSTLNKGVSASQ